MMKRCLFLLLACLSVATTYAQTSGMHALKVRLFTLRDNARQFKSSGEYEKAMDCYDSLLAMPLRPADAINTKLNLSDLYLLTGQNAQAIALLRSFNAKDHESTRLMNLATAYAGNDSLDRALSILKPILKAHEARKDSIYVITANNIGFICQNARRYNEARRYISIALQLTKDRQRRYNMQGNLALAEAGCGDFTAALTHIGECIGWQKPNLGENHPDYIIALRKKAEILMMMKRTGEAASAFRDFFEHEKNAIARNFAFMTETERINYWNSQKSLLAECYSVEAVAPTFLYNVALFSKSVLLQTNHHIEELAAKDKTADGLFTSLRQLRLKIRSARETDRKEIAGWESEAAAKERRLMKSLHAYADFVSDFGTDISQIRRALDDNDDVAVEFIQYIKDDTSRCAALLAHKTGDVKFIPLFTEDELNDYALHGNTLLGTLREAVYSNNDNDKDRLYTDTMLGRKIWSPILRHVSPHARIYFSPEGMFHLLAIEYLCFDHQGGVYRLSSTRQLLHRGTFDIRHSKMLMFGGLNYSDTLRTTPSPTAQPDRSASMILTREGIPPTDGRGYPYLAGSLVEVDSIMPLFAPSGVTLYRGSQGTEAVMKHEAPRYPCIHISTHGFCIDYQSLPPSLFRRDSLTEDRSLSHCGIIMAGANDDARDLPENQRLEDGILTAREICDLNLSATQLIVMSACQTALGRITADGIAGLPRALKKAGVHAIIASLWEVNDHVTQLFMHAFYGYLVGGKSPHEALMMAQRYVRTYEEHIERHVYPGLNNPVRQQTATYDRPSLWAPFILIDGI